MKIAFFPGCMTDMFHPEIGMAAVRVLERLGCELELPDQQVCCGQMFFNSGFGKQAVPAIKNVIDAYQGYETVVSFIGSCAYAIKVEAGNYLKDDPVYAAKHAELAPRIYEFTEFIVDVLGVTDVGAYFPHSVCYHKSCHMTRLLDIKSQPLKLLEGVEGLTLVEMDHADRCCGFGGTFSLKEPEISEQIVREKVQTAIESGADYLTGADIPCLMNIGGCLQRMREHNEVDSKLQVIHLAQILDSRKGA